LPHRLVKILATCKYASWFHDRALHATAEPFLRKEDDPLNGFWLYKCLREAGEGPVEPLRTFSEAEAHNMACISNKGLYRRPSNSSIAVHFLKTVSAMRYVAAVLRSAAVGAPIHSRQCCTRMVWPTERFRHAPGVCNDVLSTQELALESAIDTELQAAPELAAGGKRGGRNGRRKRMKAMAAATERLEAASVGASERQRAAAVASG